jgi:hypothetical protein
LARGDVLGAMIAPLPLAPHKRGPATHLARPERALATHGISGGHHHGGAWQFRIVVGTSLARAAEFWVRLRWMTVAKDFKRRINTIHAVIKVVRQRKFYVTLKRTRER